MSNKKQYRLDKEPIIYDRRAFSSALQNTKKWDRLFRLRINNHVDILICSKSYLAPISDLALPRVILSAIKYSLGRYTYMPSVTTSFTIRHLDYLDPTIRAHAADLINSHLTICGKHEPQPELWYELLNILSGDFNMGRRKRMRKIQPVDSMERISRQYLVENMDEILDRITNEDIGMVITEDGKDDLVICPYSWYSPYDDDDFGCIVNSALRDAMHAKNEDQQAVIQFVKRHCCEFDRKTLDVAVQDIMREIERPLTPLDEPQVWQELLILLQQCLQTQDSEQERSSPNA